ncbi:DUF3014 domain-containing protein [Alkalimonas sp. MEB108]|uniref:DUF3014 domain-containing protein n=1 Tax=Alkalimonas cellulosilytica TaxID=3058395 RepID=A0ABU7J592_9GAMM|nr:DUF3014 domain-containing protein [Alkalimonas sp. MEB108]MEE2001675.1 DUF3014 domain-containing protein [Alkalimonas sp. MEB108]
MTERESSEASAPGQQLYYLGLAAVVLVILIAGWLLFRSDSPAPEPEPMPPVELVPLPDAEPYVPDPIEPQPLTEIIPVLPPEAVTSEPPVEALPEPDPEPKPELPALNESDAEVSQALLQLPWQPGLAGLFVREDMLRRLVVLTDNVSRGQISSDHLVFTTPEQPFAVRRQDEQLTLDPAGFRRYEPYLTLLESVPVSTQVALLRHYQPLLDEAFAELGYPDKPFKQRLLQAIDYLLAQPVVDGVFELELPSVMYHFAEPHIEAMSDVQKQLIRIGPDNQRRLNQHLQRLKTELSHQQNSN